MDVKDFSEFDNPEDNQELINDAFSEIENEDIQCEPTYETQIGVMIAILVVALLYQFQDKWIDLVSILGLKI